MKKQFLFLLLATVLQAASAQHMYRESTDNCNMVGMWYHVNDVCTASGESALRCDYCGIYYNSVSAKNSHQKGCKYRPKIDFGYDAVGNRTSRKSQYYHWGKKITAYNESGPFSTHFRLTSGSKLMAVILRRNESEEYICEQLI